MRRPRFVRARLVALVAVSLMVGPAAPARAVAPNSALPGSTCEARSGIVFDPPPNGESTTALGTDAPAYYEVGMPTGAFVGQHPKGVMLVIHGGAWYLVGKAMVRGERNRADWWRAHGWMTVNLDYRACARSIRDVHWFMQRVRDLYPNAVVCAQGSSAGGHLALLLAAKRRDLACVIALASPTNLLSLPYQLTVDPATGLRTSAGSTALANLAAAAFGADRQRLASASPRSYVSYITARVLLASGETDWLVPVAQNASFAKAFRAAQPDGYVDVALLPAGSQPFVHTNVTAASLDDLAHRKEALVAPLV